jgi:gamma-glutamyltranspeptidase/glutathione hydrolase
VTTSFAGQLDLTRDRLTRGRRGLIATSQHRATEAGRRMFESGGNAVDAAVAAAIALTVVEPTSNGIGGDAFAIVWDGGPHGLNASGRSPAALPAERWLRRSIPQFGWPAVTVPGAPAAWAALSERWGRLPFDRLCEPAIAFADEGFAVGPVTAETWSLMAGQFADVRGPAHDWFHELFFPQGRAPRAGETWRSPDHARTLRDIAASRAESVYTGDLAARLVRFAEQTGGWLRADDLAAHQPEWVAPIATEYRGLTVHELPPNGQGVAALAALNILETFDPIGRRLPDDEATHRMIEAMKLAFADAHAHVADPATMRIDVERLLDKAYARQRAALIGDRAMTLPPTGLDPGGTVYLAAADPDLAVSFIQSNYLGFGSGVAVPGTGIALQNRGFGFNPDPDHPNAVAPGKRPYHTIIPGFLSEHREPVGPFGLMGGHMQPQGHVQLVTAMVDFGLDPQAALDAPRFFWTQDRDVDLEPEVPHATRERLAERGHRLTLPPHRLHFGKGQIILRTADGCVAGSEPRSDGRAIGWDG